MSIYAELPDGRRLEFPDGTDSSVIQSTVKKFLGKAGPAPTFDPSEGGGSLSFGPWDTGIKTPQWVDRVLSGAGKAFADTGARVKQIATGNSNQAEIDALEVGDAPLMRTGAGIVGNVIGNLAQMAGPAAGVAAIGKAAAIPFLVRAASGLMAPTTIPGAAAVGAGMGAMQPVGSKDSTLKNVLTGGVAGAAVPAAVAGVRLAKDIVYPFFKGGQEALAARTLQRFATDPNAIANAVPKEIVPGSLPTLAEATQDPGLAQLQRTLRNNLEANSAITNRMTENQAARVKAVESVAGDPGQREFFDAARRTAADELYAKAFAESPTMTPWIKGQITQLEKRPSFNAAFKEAAGRAAEDGLELNPENTVQVLHYTKMALDAQISAAARAGDNNAVRAITGTKNKLLSLIETANIAPSYGEARKTFAEMSKPINQMDLGQALRDKLIPALADFGATNRVHAGAYAQAIRNGDQTARTATGFQGAKMRDIFNSDQMQAIENVAHDLGRSANASSLGIAQGSPTVQNLTGQDILRQTLGPFGLPKGWAEAALPAQILKGSSVAYSGVDNRVMGLLGKAAIDPKEAQRLIAKELRKQALQRQIDDRMRYAIAPSTAGLLGWESAQ